MSPNVTGAAILGPVTLGDDPALHRIVCHLFADGVEEGPLDLAAFGRTAPPATDSVFWAVVGGEVAGFVTFRPHDHRGTWLDVLYVAPEFRRRGIARELLSRVVAEARQSSALNVLTMTASNNDGMAAFLNNVAMPALAVMHGQMLAQ